MASSIFNLFIYYLELLLSFLLVSTLKAKTLYLVCGVGVLIESFLLPSAF